MSIAWLGHRFLSSCPYVPGVLASVRTKPLLLSSIALLAIQSQAHAAETTKQVASGHRHVPSRHGVASPAVSSTVPAQKTAVPAKHRQRTNLESRSTESVSVTARQLTGRDAEQAFRRPSCASLSREPAPTVCWTGCRGSASHPRIHSESIASAPIFTSAGSS